MHNILVINSGSSSLKYQLIDMENETVLAKGLCERIGIDNSFLKHTTTGQDTVVLDIELRNHKVAIKEVLKILTEGKTAVIRDLEDIKAVGHRVVHGGERFHSSVIINDAVMTAIKGCVEMAPLHNPPNITGIEACQQIIPGVPQVAVFDTAFHQTMPRVAYTYAIPREYDEKYGIRKYGFHGTSHKYVSRRAAYMLGKPIKELKIITCHLGNGGSVCAVNKGLSVDTSMGFTPLDGLVMGTRCGIIDAAAILHIMEHEKLNPEQMSTILNKKSGLLGISGVSDFRDLLEKYKAGDEIAKLAIDLFTYRVKIFIGQYAAVMNGVDAIVFTAGIGENNSLVRKLACTGLDYLGVEIDDEKNNQSGDEFEVSKDGCKTKVLVIATNEELAIARETMVVTDAE
ncbi:MAG: acetate kinase [Clostridiales bacterium]|jgi:acetate kinase|nr:acetate kinase [Clostridiales bacterium]